MLELLMNGATIFKFKVKHLCSILVVRIGDDHAVHHLFTSRCWQFWGVRSAVDSPRTISDDSVNVPIVTKLSHTRKA